MGAQSTQANSLYASEDNTVPAVINYWDGEFEFSEDYNVDSDNGDEHPRLRAKTPQEKRAERLTKAGAVESFQWEDGRKTEVYLNNITSLDLVAACKQKLPPPDVIVNIDPGSYSIHKDKGLLELNTKHRASRNTITYTFGSTTAEFDYSYTMSAKYIHGGRHLCLSPQVEVNIKQNKQIVEIAKELVHSSCLEQETINHELEHVKINNRFMLFMASKIKEDILKNLNQTQIVYGTVTQTERWLRERSRISLDKTIAPLKDYLSQMHYNFDSIEESERLLHVCNGEGSQLINRMQIREHP